MVSRRRVLAGTLAALPLGLGAQPARRRKLGILGIGEPAGFFGEQRDLLLEELARLGYVPGRTLDVEERYEMESPEKLAEYARELVAAKVDAIITEGTVATLAAQAATRSIPIVTTVGDPVIAGFAKEVRRPGGNITGISQNREALAGKQLEIMRLLRPKLAIVGIVYEEPHPGMEILTAPMARALQAASIPVRIIGFQPGEFPRVLGELKRLRIDTVLDMGLGDRDRLALARTKRLVVARGEEQVLDGSELFAVVNDSGEDYLLAAAALDRVFRGSNPADMPFIQPLRYRMTFNLRVARALGIRVPPEVLLRADRVIE